MHSHDCTFYGLHKWHDSMFEKLGWMAKAHKHNNKLKIDSYMEGIKHLMQCLSQKITDTQDPDRKKDLIILQKNTQCLERCVHKLLNHGSHEDNSKCVEGQAHKATNCGLGKWMKYKYEKLGWMCLAMEHAGHSLKIQAYLDSIERLAASLKLKLEHLQEQDRKDDVNIIYEDVCTLQAAAHKLLTISNVAAHKTMSKRTKKSTHRHTM